MCFLVIIELVAILYFGDSIKYDLNHNQRSIIMTHEQVWTAIEIFAKERGLSCSGLAKRSGLNSTTFNKSKRYYTSGRPRWVSLESVSKIINFANISAVDFFKYVDNAPKIKN